MATKYFVYTDAAGTRRATVASATHGGKPMEEAHAHEYDCIVCGAHFDNSKDLLKHNEEAHLKNAQGMERPREDNGRETQRAESD